MTRVVRLAVWSGPRNISTALMRSWENRPDSIVVDEPLYAHYLAVSGVDHPGRADVIAAGDTDWRAVVDRLLGAVPPGVAVFYQKHMAHHLTEDVDRGWIAGLTNVLFIRDPREVVASYLGSRDQVTDGDIGLVEQTRLYDELDAAGSRPTVIDSADFLRDPRAYLCELCRLVDVPFVESMLAWPAGPRATDGVWGRYWYHAVWQSTGFVAPPPRDVRLPANAEAVVARCRPLYERLRGLRRLLG